MMKQAVSGAALWLALCGAWRMEASVIRQDYKTTGDGLVTFDTTTGYSWLDATVTLGESPNQALSANPGYEFADLAQVTTLLEDAGDPAADINTGAYYTADLPAVNNLAQLLRLTDVWVQYYGAGAAGWEYQGFGNLLSSSGNGWSEEMIDARNPPLGSQGAATLLYGFSNNLSSSSSNNFDFLVKVSSASPTPEPGTIWLFGAGVVSLGGLRRFALRSGRCLRPTDSR
jgi:hypothetical protein